jgi:hypothetical protein
MDGLTTPTEGSTTSYRSIYLNLEFPSPSRKWTNIFDAWIYGDIQQFAQLVLESITTGSEGCMDRVGDCTT